MNLDLFNNLSKNEGNGVMKNFIKELNDFLERENNTNIANEKYSNYWKYQNSMRYNVAANIGISRWATDITYNDDLSKAIDDSILELSNTEGALYRKQFSGSGPIDNPTFMVDKFENGKIEHLYLSADKVPVGFDDEDIIFQYKSDGSTKVRMDLKEKAIKLSSEKTANLKTKENEKAESLKIEGHIYEAFEDDGYVFLNDITKDESYSFEDIDFVVDKYVGEGKYQVIDGEYKKI